MLADEELLIKAICGAQSKKAVPVSFHGKSSCKQGIHA
jgi:hypothetical protein